MLNHYKAMIPHCSHLLIPLTALTKKSIKFEWTKEHQQAFDLLKNSLAHEVLLTYPDILVPFEIYTNASNTKLDPSLLKRTSHLHSIPGNSPILKRDTL
jgi:hypothetical protein